MQDPFHLRRFPRRLIDAARGLRMLVGGSANARIHLAATLVVIGLGLWLGLDRFEWSWVAGAFGLVWATEAVNSAIETLADRVCVENDPLIGRAKDLAAGAVLAAAIAAATIGLLIFIPRLIAL